MSRLPDHPDPGQFRREAAPADAGSATPGDAGAAASGGTGAGQSESARTSVLPSEVKSWQEMLDWSARLLWSRTGADVADWNRRIAGAGLADEPALRAWLTGHGVTGYPQALLVWERFGYPHFLTAGPQELIDGQYADRPRLRPVLDAVLAVLPGIGEVSVQARKTCVSLVSPRRNFAAVQPTAKSRVDLGLRLDHTEPGGRLLAARNVGGGPINRRIALTGPDDIDAEVIGWLRQAYQESVAPPAPRRPARRPGPELGELTVLIDGYDLPGLTCRPDSDGTGHRNVHVALAGPADGRQALELPGRPNQAIEPVPGDSAAARWEFPVTVRRDADGGLDFAGPFVRGDRTDRHVGLVWGDVPGDGTLRLFRGAKLRLADVPGGLITEALRPGRTLVARIRLTDANGNPVCARVRPPALTWSVQTGCR